MAERECIVLKHYANVLNSETTKEKYLSLIELKSLR
jgi:hypothetical protein